MTDPGRSTPAPDRFWYRPFVCTLAGLVGNILLTAGKLIFGLLAGSAALVADGFHSLADVLSDVGILLALKAAARPPDHNHPYGHHSFETLGAVAVAAFMIVAAGLIAKSAITNLVGGTHLNPEWPALAATIVSVVVKEVMARYTLAAGRVHNSPALRANGAMHRSDAISSIAAAVGIGGAMLGWPVLDSLAALVISLFILKMGFDLMRENVMALMDTMPDAELVAEIRAAALSVGCVQEVRSLHVRQRGSWYLADLSIALHPDHTLDSAHEIAHAAEDRIRERLEKIAGVFVHVEPGDRDNLQHCSDHPPKPLRRPPQ